MIDIFALFMMINAERTVPLQMDATLSYNAQYRAELLCSQKFFSHDYWQSSFYYLKPRYIGENLARDFKDATSTNDALMASPTHRANIVNTKYTKIGIGQSCGNVVELFMSEPMPNRIDRLSTVTE